MTTLPNTKRIKLTQGKYALVDEEDFERVNKISWFAHKQNCGFYAKRKVIKSGVTKFQPMAGFIMRSRLGVIVDHINHDTLDNRKHNLRIVTHSQNRMNERKRPDCSSKYKGVCWHKKAQKWVAYIGRNKKLVNIGIFSSEKEAAIAYDKAAISSFEQFALLNKTLFPKDFQ